MELVGRARVAMLALAALAVALRAWAYFANTSLWLDEVLLSRNIIELPLRHLLTEPLYLDQVAPRGFLLFEKLAVIAFGPTELALRLFPFLCALASVFLFYRLAEAALDGLAPIWAMALFAIAVPFIKFGADVKQYAVDAAVAMVLLRIALKVLTRDLPTRHILLYGALGFVAAALSQAAVLVMAGIGAGLAVDWLMSRDGRTQRALTLMMPLWAAVSVAALLVGLRSMTPATRVFMKEFWASGFLPWHAGWQTQVRWPWVQFTSLFGDLTLLRYEWPAAFAVLALAGIVVIWRRRRSTALVLAGPFAIVLLAAAVREYPFRGRLIFFLVPATLLALAAGIDMLRRAAARLHPAFGVIVLAAVFAAPLRLIVQWPPPYEIESWRLIGEVLQRERRPGDVVYVFPLQRVGLQFYGPRYGLQPGDWITGVCERRDPRAYVRDVDRFRGVSRLWVITGGQRPFRNARRAVAEYLGAIGTRQQGWTFPSLTFVSTDLTLYDLSDRTRHAAASAETFPVLPVPADPPPGCRPWSSANAETDRHLGELSAKGR